MSNWHCPAKDPVLREFLLAGVLGSHFIGVKETQNFKVIPCNQITSRVVFVRSDDAGVDGYVSSVLKSYHYIDDCYIIWGSRVAVVVITLTFYQTSEIDRVNSPGLLRYVG